MIFLVIWLFFETQRAVDKDMQMYGKVQHTLKRERCTYAVITTFFALSYIGRFYLNEFEYCEEFTPATSFAFCLSLVLVWLLEGVSMGVLMVFHLLNFKSGSLLRSRDEDEEEVPFASIKLGEYHFFTNEEVDAHSLADRSSDRFESSAGSQSD